MSGNSIGRAVLVTAIAAGLVAASPAFAGTTTYNGNGITDPAVSVVVKVKGKDKPFVRSVQVISVTYTCTDGTSITAPEAFTVGSLDINDKGRFRFSGQAEEGGARLRLSGKLSGKEISGSFTEVRERSLVASAAPRASSSGKRKKT